MYKEFFGLDDTPFTLTPDPRFIVFTPSYNEVLASLYYGLENAKGLIVLTGEVGTGKTTALRWILRRLDASVLAAYVFNPRLSIDEFYHHVTQMLGIKDWSNKSELLNTMGKVLEERHRRGLRTVIIIDEAHELSDYVLEEIRLLLNFESDNAKHLQIVLTGQPELRDKLNQENLRQLKQRVALRCAMHAFPNVEEVDRYITERLLIGGSDEPSVFTPEAVDFIFQCSDGIPRQINNLCDNAMLAAYSAGEQIIGRQIIETVAENLDLLPRKDALIAADRHLDIPQGRALRNDIQDEMLEGQKRNEAIKPRVFGPESVDTYKELTAKSHSNGNGSKNAKAHSNGDSNGEAKASEETNVRSNGYSDGELNGLANANANEQTNGRPNGYSNDELNGHANAKAHEETNGRSNGYSNGEMNGHANAKANEETNGRSSGYSNGEMNGHANANAHEQTNGRSNGYSNGEMNRHANANPIEQTKRRSNGYSNGDLIVHANGRVNDETNERSNGYSNGDLNVQANGRANEETNERSNGYSNGELNGRANANANERANGQPNRNSDDRVNIPTSAGANELNGRSNGDRSGYSNVESNGFPKRRSTDHANEFARDVYTFEDEDISLEIDDLKGTFRRI